MTASHKKAWRSEKSEWGKRQVSTEEGEVLTEAVQRVCRYGLEKAVHFLTLEKSL